MTVRGELMVDACNMAFFSIGVCCGVFYAYGSFNPIKKPVIADAFIISFVDFIFSIVAGFSAWGVIGYLHGVDNMAFAQTSNFGLSFIAFPIAAGDGSGKWYLMLFYILMYVAGITSAFAYAEGLVTNLCDMHVPAG
jgi:solute carrier family 6 GABA transporter-like protein 1